MTDIGIAEGYMGDGNGVVPETRETRIRIGVKQTGSTDTHDVRAYYKGRCWQSGA